MNPIHLIFLILVATFFICSCESASQTAMRTNQIPAVAYIAHPQLMEARTIIVPSK